MTKDTDYDQSRLVGFFDPNDTDADDIPIAPPTGFIWLRPTVLSGSYEWQGIMDFRVANSDGDVVNGVLSLDQAEQMHQMLCDAISHIRSLLETHVEVPTFALSANSEQTAPEA